MNCARTIVQAVVKVNSQSNGNGKISTQLLQNPWTDFDETWNIGLLYDITMSGVWPYKQIHVALRECGCTWVRLATCFGFLGKLFIPPYGSMGGILSLLFVCLFVFVRLRISQRRKKIGAWNFACLFDYYPDRSFPILVNFGSRGVTAGALLPGCTHRRIGAKRRLPARLGGQS